jgi:hypothetical protein
MAFALTPNVATLPVIGFFVFFTAKHLLADYMLQTAAMVAGKDGRHGWLMPLSIHAGIHAGGTMLLVVAVKPILWWLAPLDFVVHAAIDRLKSVLSGCGAWRPEESRFWWLHGADQAAHHLTHFLYVLVLADAFVVG